ncbi:MAG: hypothetical protein RLN60_04755 [Phycisphaerales bacterium]
MNTRWLIDINNVVIRDQVGMPRRMSIFSTRFGFAKLPHELPNASRASIYRFLRWRYVGPTVLYTTIVLLPLCLIGSFLILAALIALGLEERVPGAWGALIAFGVYGGISWVVIELVGMPWVRRRYRRVYTEVMLFHDLCPWCGYGLRGLPVDPQGNARCPECGGWWPSPPAEEGSSERD